MITIKNVPVSSLRPADYNPRRWDKEDMAQLKESIKRFGMVDPLIANAARGREGVLVGGHMRLAAAKEAGLTEVPVVYVSIADLAKEKELNLRLNRNTGEFDWEKLATFSEDFLADIGFSSEDLDRIFAIDEMPEVFDLNIELKKLQIEKIVAKTGDVYGIGPDFRLMIGDSTVEADVLKLMSGEKADMCLTDPPYLLQYNSGKRRGKPTEGFGLKRNRTYLGLGKDQQLPPDFTEKWMANIAKVQQPDFSVIVFENPKNLRTIWNEMEKHWKYRNTIVWHLPNRVQNFAAKFKFFNKHDIALVGTCGDVQLNLDSEDALFQQEYENGLFATSGSPHWENYAKGKKYAPTDFIEFKAADEKSSGQGIIFGTKPTEILIPYLKVLTKRGDLVVDPFGGSGSTGVAALKMGRRCHMMEKSAVYGEVTKRRIEKLTGFIARKIR